MGGAAHHSGVTLARIDGSNGMFTADQLRSEVPTPHPSLPRHLYEPHTLVCLENTHNEAGGTVWDLDVMRDVSQAAEELGLARHLDGARLWNASAATGVDVSDYAAAVDTVSVCFSKGLGAPVGSALVGPTDFIAEARRFKQMFGGGMRQSGIVAAGALYALRHHREQLADDHAHARRFAERIAETENGDVDLDAVHTNIVYFEVDDPTAVVATSLDDGVAMLKLGTHRIRAVFHRDISEGDAEKASEIVASAIDR